MTRAEKQRLALVIQLLAAQFPPAEVTTPLLASYEIGLDGLAIEEIEAAGKWALQHHRRYLPNASELREYAFLAEAAAPKRRLGPRHDCPRCGEVPHDGECEPVPMPPEAEEALTKLFKKFEGGER